MQSGFRPTYNTASALVKMLNYVIVAVDSARVTILALLDYSNAFDTMNRRLFISNLGLYFFDADTCTFFT